MENKKYIDKVLDHLVKGTKIDYDREEIHFPFPPSSPVTLFSFFSLSAYTLPVPSLSFSYYCKNEFGLTNEEIDYVWEMYKDIIKDKIENNEQ